MSTPPTPELNVELLLAELRSADPARRKDAADKIAQQPLSHPEVTEALRTIAEQDPSSSVAWAARDALKAISGSMAATSAPANAPNDRNPPDRTPKTSRFGFLSAITPEWRHFLLGFISWYVANGVLWFALGGGVSTGGEFGGIQNILICPANLIVLGIALFKFKYFALGLLASFAVNFSIALVLGLQLNAYCWIPFFVK